MTNQLKTGAILSYINIFVNLCAGLLYTPIMIRLLGQAEYGLYSLIGSMAGYLTILDMGLGNTIVRYIAQNKVLGNRNSEARLNGAFLLFYLLIGVFTIIVGSILFFNMEVIFSNRLNVTEMYKAKIMLALLIFNFAFSFPLSVFSSIMQAYERFVSLRIVHLLRAMLTPLTILPFLYMGFGSITMVVITILFNMACLLFGIYYCFRYLKVKFIFHGLHAVPIKEITTYSFLIFLNAIIDKIYWSTGQTILGIITGTEAVAVYAIAMQFAMMYMAFSTAISGVLLPKVTRMVAENVENTVLSALMIKIGRLQYFVVGFLLAAFVVCGKEFLFLWAGKSYLGAYEIVLVIMISLLIPLIQNTGIAILQAKNLNKFRVKIYIFFAFINLIISIPMARIYGGIGCAVVTGISLLLSSGLIINIYYYKLGLDIKSFWVNIWKVSIPILSVLLFGYLLNAFYVGYQWNGFLEKVFLLMIIYSFSAYYLAMNTYEKSIIQTVIYKVIRKH